ncbi:hypothetical protein DM02DRAFT_734565 [Periconia macrospinosa]|uniref:Uncharacterized protein n=1 Tax=Periconia macrospinosa TaxID=97972 RepID=A0A2V1CXK9_9PLEO|nr:hypothetical protein DM02DRAFT_734565 [Periconia macrospinosa]
MKSTPLHHAVTERWHDGAQKLLQGGANPNASDKVKRTALHKAARRSNYPIVRLLLDADNIDIDAVDIDGETALHDASYADGESVVQLLIESGANINVESKKGWTPLHTAASKNACKAVIKLLEAGASTTSCTKSMETPNMIAEKKGHEVVVRILRTTIKLSGQDLLLSKPNTRQNAVNAEFRGCIWPCVCKAQSHEYDNPTISELLYQEAPSLKGSRVDYDSASPRWIHIPANNDAFKLLYLVEDTTESKGKSTTRLKQSQSEHERMQKSLRDILCSINEVFGDTSKAAMGRHGHFMSRYILGPKSPKNQIVFLSLPLVDIDMQQPAYFSPKRDETLPKGPVNAADGVDLANESGEAKEARKVKEYTTHPGRDLDEQESARVENLENLWQSYHTKTQLPLTLDGYSHEFLDEDSLKSRNGDQVISRFIARHRFNWEKNEEEDGNGAIHRNGKRKIEATVTSLPKKFVSATEHLGRRSRGDEETEEKEQQATSPGEEKIDRVSTTQEAELTIESHPEKEALKTAQIDEPHIGSLSGQSKSVALETPKTPHSSSEVTPSRLESQEQQIQHWLRKWLPCFRHQQSKDSGNLGRGLGRYFVSSEPVSHATDEGAEDSDDETSSIILANEREKEDTVVTSFPERYDLSNERVLPLIILKRLRDRDIQAKKREDANGGVANLDVDEVVEEIVKACLEFEAYLVDIDGERSYLDAFGGEIAFVSRQVTRCYERYRNSLPVTIKNFSKAIEEETEYLLMIDDILSEIGMVKRVQQDQNKIEVAMRDILRHTAKSSTENSGTEAQNSPCKNRHGYGTGSQAVTPDLQDNPLRSSESKHMIRKLERLEEDAKMTRKSVGIIQSRDRVPTACWPLAPPSDETLFLWTDDQYKLANVMA